MKICKISIFLSQKQLLKKQMQWIFFDNNNQLKKITIYNQSINSIEEFSTNISSLTNKNSFDYIDNNTLIDEINNKQHVVLQDFIMQKHITHQTT